MTEPSDTAAGEGGAEVTAGGGMGMGSGEGKGHDTDSGATVGTTGGERRGRRGKWRDPRRAFAGRQLQHQVKLTEDERDRLHAKAAEKGVSVSRLMVESALADDAGVPAAALRRELAAALREHRRVLGTVANNVNQLAHQANIAGDTPSGERLDRLVAEVDAVVAEVRALARRVA